MTRKTILSIFLALLILTVITIFWFKQQQPSWKVISPLESSKELLRLRPLEKYEFEKLKSRGGKRSEIILEKVLKEEDSFTSHLFSYASDGHKITGLLNLPKQEGELPVVVMLRGYVDQEIYETGVGTARAGEVYADNGFITLAPDFLGYGGSDMPPDNVWEERFLRLTSVLDLLASINSLAQADMDKVFLWGHSNGGMVALSILEISGGRYPTTLWAPVSQDFPYDILYYTYEFDDGGKALRKSLADFEKDYDTDKYSFSKYLDWINAPLLVHQGTSDEYIPVWWSDNLVDKIKSQDKKVDYYLYSNADHNMKGSWNVVVQRDLDFFRSWLSKPSE